MPLIPPKLDDRDFFQLLEEAKNAAKSATSAAAAAKWSPESVGDPGVVLLELFAHLTEVMIYRLNRLPEKAYIEFLRLLGVQLQPPHAARASVVFSVDKPLANGVAIERGTRITTARGGAEPIMFVTLARATIPAGQTSAAPINAIHCDIVEYELVGKGTGRPGLSLAIARPPIIAKQDDFDTLIVWVEAGENESVERDAAGQIDGKLFRQWKEVDGFSDARGQHVYMVDRVIGTIMFAPAARLVAENGRLASSDDPLARVPPMGKEIRVTYLRGGGVAGNVPPNTLTVIRDPLPVRLNVTNQEWATGGAAAESVENAKIRGPEQIRSVRRAVTARDFEDITRETKKVSRARAFTRLDLWKHADPGSVEVTVVPAMPTPALTPRQVSLEALRAQETGDAIAAIRNALETRKPLGSILVVNWSHYKKVSVKTRVEVHANVDEAAIASRVTDRLYGLIDPLPTSSGPGWPFGESLSISDVYDVALREPGVRRIIEPKLLVEDVPETEVACLAADQFQPQTWYAGSSERLFRSLNDAGSWELLKDLENQRVAHVAPSPYNPGLVAACARTKDGAAGSWIYTSRDCGDTWTPPLNLGFNVQGVAWILRDNAPIVIMATNQGLYELAVGRAETGDLSVGAVPIVVLPDKPDLGFYAVATTRDISGRFSVAVAAEKNVGVYLSTDGGRSKTFRPIELGGRDVRVLQIQKLGIQSFLWAGLADDDPKGKGCLRWELPKDPTGWQDFGRNWARGSCQGIVFQGDTVLASSFDGGVLRLAAAEKGAQWEQPDINCGLRRVSEEHLFESVGGLATNPSGKALLAGTKSGVYRSRDGGKTYESCSRKEFTEELTIPPNWLFCSGEHQVEVVEANGTKQD